MVDKSKVLCCLILSSQANEKALIAHLVNKALKCLPDLFLCRPALSQRLHLASQRKGPCCFSAKGPSLSMREVWRRQGVIFHCLHTLRRLPNTEQRHSPLSTCLNDTPKQGSLKWGLMGWGWPLTFIWRKFLVNKESALVENRMCWLHLETVNRHFPRKGDIKIVITW